MRAPGTHLYGWIAAWLDPADAEQVAWPLLADVQAEWSQAAQSGDRRRAVAIRLAGYFQLLRACLAVGATRRWRETRRLELRKIFPLLLVGLLGAWMIYWGRLGASRGPSQLVYLAMGFASALGAATTSPRQLRLLAPVFAGVSLLVLAAVPLIGARHGGTGRWLQYGGLFFHAALLVMPLIFVGLARIAHRPLWFSGLLAAVLVLLGLQPNLPATGIVAVGAVAMAWLSPSARPSLAPAVLLSAGGVGVAVALAPTTYAAQSFEILTGHLLDRGLVFVLASGLGLAWLAWTSWTLARDAARPSRRDGFRARLGLGCAIGLPAQVLVLTVADGAMPLLTYGGTATLAMFVTLGLALAARQPERVLPATTLSALR